LLAVIGTVREGNKDAKVTGACKKAIWVFSHEGPKSFQ